MIHSNLDPPPPPPTTMVVAPPVVQWFRVYAGAMAALYALLFFGGILAMGFLPTLPKGPDDPPTAFLIAYGGLFMSLGLLFGGAFAAIFFLKPQPWVWSYSLVLICLGMTSACCIPACVPLLIFWLKPEVQRWYGR
jgi:MFS family permease